LTVVADKVNMEDFQKITDRATNLRLNLIIGDPRDRGILDEQMAKNYDHVIILSSQKELGIQESDANTLFVLLQLRDISEKTGSRFSVVSEMLDFRNKKLAEVTKVNDFIVSEKLISLMMSQIAENKMLNSIFEDLFDAEGSELYIKKAADYVAQSQAANFYHYIEAGRRRNEVVIGYVIEADQKDADKNYGIHINPPKAETILLCDQDGLIVISED